MPIADLQEPLLVKKEEEEEKSENHDYSQIPEELWFHGEEVAVSVAPEDPSAEIPPPSVTVLPGASSTSESDRQKASLNCMDILLPAYPWGPKGGATIQG